MYVSENNFFNVEPAVIWNIYSDIHVESIPSSKLPAAVW